MHKHRKHVEKNAEYNLLLVLVALAVVVVSLFVSQFILLYGHANRPLFKIVSIFQVAASLTLSALLALRIILWFRNASDTLTEFESILSTLSPDGMPKSERRQILFRMMMNLDYFESNYNKTVATSIAMKQAEINALQSQINPHFLYNILDSIRGQALIENMYDIADMTEALANYFRYCISSKDDIVTLENELKNVENYWMIQRYRFEDKISMEIILDDIHSRPGEYSLPKLILQPIVENAVYHGLETKVGPGKVIIRVTETPKRLIISVTDDGIGMGAEELDLLKIKLLGKRAELAGSKESQHGSGVALVNVNERIKLHFGDEYGLQISSARGIGTEVEVTLPIIKRQSAGSQLYTGGILNENTAERTRDTEVISQN